MVMVAPRLSRLANRSDETNISHHLTREEFHKLMKHDEDYTDPDFAGMSDWPSNNVGPWGRFKPPTVAKPVLAAVALPHIRIDSLSSQYFEEDPPSASLGRTSNQAFSQTSLQNCPQQPTTTGQMYNKDFPSDKQNPQFDKLFDGHKIDHSVQAKESALPKPVSPKHVQSDSQHGPEPNQSPFFSYHSRPLTGNEFYDRRPPPGFSLLDSVQKSAAEYSEVLRIADLGKAVASTLKTDSRSSAVISVTFNTPGPNLPSSASHHDTSANYHGGNNPPVSASHSARVGGGKERKPEHSPATFENRRGSMANRSDGGPASKSYENQVGSVSIRESPKSTGGGRPRQFKPTTKKKARRSIGLRK